MATGANIRLPSLTASFAHGRAGTEVETICQARAYERLLLIGSASARTRYDALWRPLDALTAATFFAAEAHCPEDTVEACREVYRDYACDACIVAGGGSTLGLGKILKTEEGAGFVAVPTTYSGSEATAIFGRKIGQEKRTRIDERCRPDEIVYDASLTASLPGHIMITSAMNSIAHAVEALYPRVPNPVAAVLARECLAAHKQGFELLRTGEADHGREQLLYAGFLGGMVIGMTGIALHHQLCHVIGGLFDLPHAESNAVLLPHVVAYNCDHAPLAVDAILTLFGGGSPGGAIYDFVKANGGPLSLEAIGMPATGIDTVVHTMLEHGGYNPRPLEAPALHQLVSAAFEGSRPNQERQKWLS